MNEAKPFSISKREVWDAYQRVKANKGAAGTDEQSIAEFDRDLKGNLYKLWNRMSSGSYFPAPVRTVKIPKAGGGERKLGIPTVADRIAQTVVKARMEPKVEPLFHPNSFGQMKIALALLSALLLLQQPGTSPEATGVIRGTVVNLCAFQRRRRSGKGDHD